MSSAWNFAVQYILQGAAIHPDACLRCLGVVERGITGMPDPAVTRDKLSMLKSSYVCARVRSGYNKAGISSWSGISARALRPGKGTRPEPGTFWHD